MFQGWDNYYVMVGTASAGLIGLLFVVVTLTAGVDRSQAERGAKLYLTPSVLHFAIVMTISAVIIAPRLPTQARGVLIGVAALWGAWFAVRATIGINKPRPGAEPPHWSDAWMYGGSPATIYFTLAAGAVAVWTGLPWAPYPIAVLTLALLLVGIRNAWDLVTWIAPARPGGA